MLLKSSVSRKFRIVSRFCFAWFRDKMPHRQTTLNLTPNNAKYFINFMRLEKTLLTILRVGVFLIFLTPLIYTGSTIFPFIFGKTLYFRAVAELLFALYLILILIFPKYRPRSSLLFSAILIYTFILILATIFSVDVTRSFWSNHERMMGVFTFFHALALFIVAAGVFRDKEDWKKVFIFSTGISFVMSFLGIYQYFQRGTFLHSAGGGQVYSTLGNYIYFGGYCLWHIFVAFAFLLRSKVRLGERFFWIFSVLINAVGLILAGSRGPFLGAFIGILLAVFCYTIFARAKKIRLAMAVILIIIISAGGLIWFNKNSDFVKNNRYLARFTDISLVTATGSTRLLNWGVAWEAFKNRPILGWGPDNYYIAFNQHFNPKFYEFGLYETWQDHAHNVIFDTLNESGILGLLSYLFIFFAFYFTLFKALVNKENKDISLIIFPGAAATAYFIQNLFVFDTLTILMLFYTILSFTHSSYGSSEGGELKAAQEEDKYPRESASKKINPRESASVNEVSGFWQKLDPAYKYTFVAGTILFAMAFVYYVDIGPFKASQLTIRALQTYYSDFNKGYNLFKEALAIHSPYLKETRDEFSKMILALGNAKTGLPQEQLKNYFDEATIELEKTKNEHPKDVYIHMYLSQWYFSMAALFDPAYMQNAEEESSLAINLSPNRPQVYYTAARMYMVKGDFESAEKMLLKVQTINPNIGDTYWYLGVLYSMMEKKDLSYENVLKALNAKTKSISVNSYDLKVTAPIVAERATSTKILDWYLTQSGGTMLYAQNYIDLAKAYKRLGDKEKMMLALRYATSTDANLTKEAEEVLKN